MRISDWSSDVCSSDLGKRVSPRRRGPISCRLKMAPTGDGLPPSREHGFPKRGGGLPQARKTRLQPVDHELRRERGAQHAKSEEHTSELQSLMRRSYAVFRSTKKI